MNEASAMGEGRREERGWGGVLGEKIFFYF